MTTPAPTRAARLIVDLDAVALNYHHLQRLARSSQIAAVVKANAYGLGAAAVARRLEAEGCQEFYVATAHEGAALRQVIDDPATTIWVLNGFGADHADVFKHAILSPVLNSVEQVADYTAPGLNGPFALHVDTAMNRLGVSLDDAAELAASGLQPDLVMSHLACSEEADHPLNATQRQRFTSVAALFPNARHSLSNTGGIFLGNPFHFDQCRAGIGLYGATADPGQPHGLKPVARLEAPVLQLRQLQPGDTVGYGATFTADRPMRTATIAAGYADGLPRALSNSGWARVGGDRAPILGRISMDLTVLDITHVNVEPRVGDTVSVYGEDLNTLAIEAGMLPYELLTRIGPNVERVAK